MSPLLRAMLCAILDGLIALCVVVGMMLLVAPGTVRI